MSRTVTKVIFHDSSDDEVDTNGVPGTTTTIVDVRQDNLCMNEDELVCPEEHYLRCEEVVGDDNGGDGLFVEDALPDLEKAKGTLSVNHANTVEVQVMNAPSKREGGFAPRRPGKRPENASVAHSTRKRLRDDDEEEDGAAVKCEQAETAVSASEGMTTDEMLEAASAHGLPAPPSTAVDALDTLEEEVVKAVLLPNGTNRDPLAIKVSTEGYRLSLDEQDVQEVFEDEDGFEEEDEEEDHELQMLMAVSAIEQMIGACERYQPNEEDGGMCPWAEEAEKANTEETLIESTSTAATSGAIADEGQNGDNAARDSGIKNNDNDKAVEIDISSTSAPRPLPSSSSAEQGDGEQPQQQSKRIVYRPRIFDNFVEKGKALLAQLQANEITADDLIDALEEDVDAVQRAFKRINRPVDSPIYIEGVKMDF